MRQRNNWDYVIRILIAVGIIGLFIILLWLIWSVAEVLLLIFMGLLVAVVLRTLAQPIARYTPLSKKLAVLAVLLILVFVTLIAGWLVVPEIAAQTEQLVAGIIQAINQAEAFLLQFGWGEQLLEQIFQQDPTTLPIPNPMNQLTQTFNLTLNSITNTLFVLFVGIFVALEPHLYRKGFVSLIPPQGRDRANEVLNAVVKALRAWLLGRLISMAVVGVVIGVGLALLGVPLALVLGLLSAVLEFIPVLGPILAAVPGILIAFTMGFMQVVYVTIFYLVIQQLEGNVLTPFVQEKTVHLPPVVTLAAVLAMGLLFGLIGVLVATPLAAVIFVLVKMLYIEDILGAEA